MATATHRNGTAPETFPLDSFREAAPHLRRPFTPEAVKFKVQATWPKDGPTGGLIVSYIDARLVVERLNLIVPHLWFDDYELAGKGLICHLTVDGITRKDIGEGVGKGLFSDALKRAAVKFGIGVSLYAVPKMILSTNDQHLKQKGPQGNKTLELTPPGESRVRKLYADWLTAHGIDSFGEPLSHGDVEGAQGDAEVEQEPVAPEPAAPLVTAEDVKAIKEAFEGLPPQKIKLAFASVGLDGANSLSAIPQAKAAPLVKALAGIERES